MRTITTARIEDGKYIVDGIGAFGIGDLISPGNSIGGWIVVRILRDRALVARISGAEKRDLRNGYMEPPIKRRADQALPVGPIRWATSSGSARRGIAHRHRPPANPLEAWRLELQLPREAVEVRSDPVEVRTGGANLRSAATGHAHWPDYFVTDGKVERISDDISDDVNWAGEPMWATYTDRISDYRYIVIREYRWTGSGPITKIIVADIDESVSIAREKIAEDKMVITTLLCAALMLLSVALLLTHDELESLRSIVRLAENEAAHGAADVKFYLQSAGLWPVSGNVIRRAFLHRYYGINSGMSRRKRQYVIAHVLGVCGRACTCCRVSRVWSARAREAGLFDPWIKVAREFGDSRI